MSLPFLDRIRRNEGVITTKTMATTQEGQEKLNENVGLRLAAKDLIAAITANDEHRVAEAIKAAFEILDSEPHVEGPHIPEGNP